MLSRASSLLLSLSAVLMLACGDDAGDGGAGAGLTGPSSGPGGATLGACTGWYTGEGFESAACIAMPATDGDYACANLYAGVYDPSASCGAEAVARCTTRSERVVHLTAPRAGSEATWRRVCETYDEGTFEVVGTFTTSDPGPSNASFEQLTGPSLQVDFAHLAPGGAVWLTSRGDIVRSADLVAWTTTAPFPDSYRRRIVAANATTAFAVDDVCTFRATTDGGATWQERPKPFTGACEAVAFADTDTGVVVTSAGTIAWTTDAGATWDEASAAGALYGVAIHDAQRAWAVGADGLIVTTTNGGGSWTPQSSGTDATLRAVAALDDQNVFAVGDAGTVARTTNGGLDWTLVTSPTAAGLGAVSFASATEGWVAGAGGGLYFTDDGGLTWAARPLPDAGVFVGAVRASSGGSAVVVGFDTNPGFWGAYETDDGGATWTRRSFGVSLTSLALSGDAGLAVGPGNVMRTQDAGATWRRVAFEGSARSVAWQDADRAVIAATDATYATDDAGATWTAIGPAVEGEAFFVKFWGDVGWAASPVAAMRTTDGGASWAKVAGPGGDGFTDAHAPDADVLILSHLDRGFVFTRDGGATWTEGDSTAFLSGGPRALAFRDDLRGYLLSSEDDDARLQVRTHLTEDAGASRRRTVLPASMRSVDMAFVTPDLGLASGDGSFLTRDGGASWVQASDLSGQDVVAAGTDGAWLVGPGLVRVTGLDD